MSLEEKDKSRLKTCLEHFQMKLLRELLNARLSKWCQILLNNKYCSSYILVFHVIDVSFHGLHTHFLFLGEKYIYLNNNTKAQ